MPPPSPRPSGRGVALLSSVPAPYPSSPECLPVPASLWLCLPPPWDPAQLPHPNASRLPTASVSLWLLSVLRQPVCVSPASACPALGCLLPSVCVSVSSAPGPLSPTFPPSVCWTPHLRVHASVFPSLRSAFGSSFLCFSPPRSLCISVPIVSLYRSHLRLHFSLSASPLLFYVSASVTPFGLSTSLCLCPLLTSFSAAPLCRSRGPPPSARGPPPTMTRGLLWPRGLASLLPRSACQPLSHFVHSLLSSGSSFPPQPALCPTRDPTPPCRVWGQARPPPLPQWAPPAPLPLPHPGA